MTPNEAAELMRRAQVGGIATSEFDAGGGYAAVKKLAESNTTGYQGGERTVADMAKYAPADKIVRFDPAGQGGLGETFYASGNSATGGTAALAAKDMVAFCFFRYGRNEIDFLKWIVLYDTFLCDFQNRTP